MDDKHIKIEDILNTLNKLKADKEYTDDGEHTEVLAFCPECYYWSIVHIRKDFLRYPEDNSVAPDGLVRVLVKNHSIIEIFDCPNCDNLIVSLYDIGTLNRVEATVKHINMYIDCSEIDKYMKTIKFYYVDREKHDDYRVYEDD